MAFIIKNATNILKLEAGENTSKVVKAEL